MSHSHWLRAVSFQAGCRHRSPELALLLILAISLLAPGIGVAQQLSGVKVEPASVQAGEPVKITVDFSVQDAINCGLRVHFGDGTTEDYRITHRRQVPLVITRAYSTPGQKTVMAEPKTQLVLGRCGGRNQTASFMVAAPAATIAAVASPRQESSAAAQAVAPGAALAPSQGGQPVAAPAPANDQFAASGKPAPVEEGDFVDNKRTGRGVKVWDGGNRYEGDWVNGERHGRGTMEYANGHRYEGDWVYNTRTGKGIYTWPDGARYEGDFSNNQRTGRGAVYQANGNRYEGDFVEGKWHGKGTHFWASGHRYEGDWDNGNRTGNGTYSWPDGNRFVGDFIENKLNSGTMYRASGAREEYVGGAVTQRYPAPVASAPAPAVSPSSGRESRDRSSNNDAAWAIAGALLGSMAPSQPRQQQRSNARPPVTQSYTPSAPINVTPQPRNLPGACRTEVSVGYTTTYCPDGTVTRTETPSGQSSSGGSGSRRDDSIAPASHCLTVKPKIVSYGSAGNVLKWDVTNGCPFMVDFQYCVERSSSAISASYACDYSPGGRRIEAGSTVDVEHVRGGSASIRYHACRWHTDVAYSATGIARNQPKCEYFGRRQS